MLTARRGGDRGRDCRGAGPAVDGREGDAEIKGKGITGRAELVERKQGTGVVVDITVSASGLTPGLHGVHLHAVGKCEPDFTAAGGHFDPGPAEQPRS